MFTVLLPICARLLLYSSDSARSDDVRSLSADGPPAIKTQEEFLPALRCQTVVRCSSRESPRATVRSANTGILLALFSLPTSSQTRPRPENRETGQCAVSSQSPCPQTAKSDAVPKSALTARVALPLTATIAVACAPPCRLWHRAR